MASPKDEGNPVIMKVVDSPVHSDLSLSPMTDLAENLSSLFTACGTFTPRQRTSLSYPCSEYPVINNTNSNFPCDTPVSASLFQERLLNYDKDAMNSRLNRKSFHRSNTLPFYSPISNKENVSSFLPTKDIFPGLQNNKQFDIGSDSDSQDSGYSGFISYKHSNGYAKHSSIPVIQNSVFADEEGEDGFASIFDIDMLDKNESVPKSMTSLLTKPLSVSYLNSDVANQDETYIRRRKNIRRCLSMTPEKSVLLQHASVDVSANSSKQQNYDFYLHNSINPVTPCENSVQVANILQPLCLAPNHNLKVSLEKHSFKRPEPPQDLSSPTQNKRRKNSPLILFSSELQPATERLQVLKRSFSETETIIMRAVQKSDQQPDLIGDFTKPFILPLIKGKHQDLKTISPKTLAELIKGGYKDSIKDFAVIDCRYPYEYNGGHIKDARNIYTREGMVRELLPVGNQPNQNQRKILIFHCEFSSERAPNLCRFLRNKDRETNKDNYPLLHFPEIYVLDGGYKAFYEHFKALCEPQQYLPMRHKDYEFDLRHFRAKSKSWSGDQKHRINFRSGLKF